MPQPKELTDAELENIEHAWYAGSCVRTPEEDVGRLLAHIKWLTAGVGCPCVGTPDEADCPHS